MKTYKFAGVSRHNGKLSFRATNRPNPTYPDLLKKEGHTDINIVELKSEMTKDEARKNLLGWKAFQTPEIQTCLKQAEKEEAKEKTHITKPVKSKKHATPKKTTKAKKAAADAETVGETPNTEAASDDSVDAASELGMPPFVKHLNEEV